MTGSFHELPENPIYTKILEVNQIQKSIYNRIYNISPVFKSSKIRTLKYLKVFVS